METFPHRGVGSRLASGAAWHRRSHRTDCRSRPLLGYGAGCSLDPPLRRNAPHSPFGV